MKWIKIPPSLQFESLNYLCTNYLSTNYIWFRLPSFTFWRKRVPIIRGFIQENDVFVYFSDEMGENI